MKEQGVRPGFGREAPENREAVEDLSHLAVDEISDPNLVNLSKLVPQFLRHRRSGLIAADHHHVPWWRCVGDRQCRDQSTEQSAPINKRLLPTVNEEHTGSSSRGRRQGVLDPGSNDRVEID